MKQISTCAKSPASRRLFASAAFFCLGLALVACDDDDFSPSSKSTEAPDAGAGSETPDAGPQVQLSALRFEGLHALGAGDTLQFSVIGRYSDGHEADLSAEAEVELLTPEAAQLAPAAGGWTLTAGAETAVLRLQASVGALSDEQQLNVLLLQPEQAITKLEEHHYALRLLAPNPGGTPIDVTKAARWSYSVTTSTTTTETSTTVPGAIQDGALYLTGTKGDRTLTVTADYDGAKITHEVELGCIYPDTNTIPMDGEAFPPMVIPGAIGPNNSSVDFSFRDAYCGTMDDPPKTVVMFNTAVWCSACRTFFSGLYPVVFLPQVSEDAEIVYWVAQDEGFNWDVSNRDAARDMDSKFPDGAATRGLRVGGAGIAAPHTNWQGSPSTVVEVFPSAFVVRTSDMKVIAYEGNGESYLPLGRITRHPDWYYGDPNHSESSAPACPAGVVDEASEPNDTIARAQEISGPTTIDGGLCHGDNLDVYHVTIQGDWRATLSWVGDADLDFYAFHASYSPAAGPSPEVVNGSGDLYFGVTSKKLAASGYSLTIEAR